MQLLELPKDNSDQWFGGPFSLIAFSPEGGYLAATHPIGPVLFESPSGECRVLPHPLDLHALSRPVWSPGGRWLVVPGVGWEPVNDQGTFEERPPWLGLFVWDTHNPGELHRMPPMRDYDAGAAVFHPREQVLFHSGTSDKIAIRAVGTWESVREFELAQDRTLDALVIDPGGRWLVGYEREVGRDQLYLLDLEEEWPFPVTWHHSRSGIEVTGISISPDGKHLASVGRANAVRIWSLPDHRLVAKLNQAGGYTVRAAEFSPDGRYLAVAIGDEGVVRFFDSSDWKMRHEFAWPLKRISSLAFSADGLRCAAADRKHIVIWDVE